MEGAIFDCPALWLRHLPPGVLGAESPAGLAGRTWDLLALTRRGRAALGRAEVSCRTLLIPGDSPPPLRAETVITCGLSSRDSLTLSSLTEPVLCVQRHLPRPDGAVIEPQEFPLPSLPGPPEELLPLLGLRLLLMPLAEPPFLW
nr:hypothetical protein [uncultured Oscillibacter sp.]